MPPRRLSSATREAVEAALEAGKPTALIAAECEVSVDTVHRIRGAVKALREKHGLPPLPPPARKPKELSEQGNAIRAEFLQSGQIRPLARKHGLTVAKLLALLDRAPSMLAERSKQQEKPPEGSGPQA